MSSVLLVSLCAFSISQIFNSPPSAIITTHNLCPYFKCHKEKCKSSEENCLISNFMIRSYQQPNAPQLITGQSFSVLCIYFLPPVPGPHCSLHHQFHSLSLSYFSSYIIIMFQPTYSLSAPSSSLCYYPHILSRNCLYWLYSYPLYNLFHPMFSSTTLL